jgi:hypothetical protein
MAEGSEGVRGNRRITVVLPTGPIPSTKKGLRAWLANGYDDLTVYELKTFLRAEGLKHSCAGDLKGDLVARLAAHDAETLFARARQRKAA